MRLERLNSNKIKIFLTLDDLTDRGLTKEDIWKDSLKWHQLFHEMLEEASVEFDVDIHGSVAVEIFSMQAQGMIMIVTMDELNNEEEEELLPDGFIDMQVTAHGSEDVLFEMKDFEEVIQLAKRLSYIEVFGGSLYAYKGIYFFHFSVISSNDVNKVIALMAEYGNPSFSSIHFLREYGIEVMKEDAVENLIHYFHSK